MIEDAKKVWPHW